MPRDGAKKPLFRSPQVSAKDLNTVANAAFGSVQIAGVNYSTDGWNTIFNPPIEGSRLMVKVYREGVSGSGSGVSGSGVSGSGEGNQGAKQCPPTINRYSFIEQIYDKCGTYIDADPTNRFAGDGIYNVAYERNNQIVTDGSIQEIVFKNQWMDETTSPPQIVFEWEFNAGGGGGGARIRVSLVECVELFAGVPTTPECPPGQHYDPDLRMCVPD